MNNNTVGQKIKVCSKCGESLLDNTDNFRPQHAQCRKCENKAVKEWREKNKDHRKAYDEKYQRENIDRVKQWKKDWADKEENKEKKRQYYYNNKEKMQEKHKEWLKNNKEKTLERQREYYKENPEVFAEIRQRRRSRKKNVEHNFSWEEWENCIEHFQHKCAYCGKKKKLQQDHFIPLNSGGEYTANNIVPACKSCNSGKCDRDFFEWYPTKEFYSKKREKFILDYLDYQSKNIQQLALFK